MSVVAPVVAGAIHEPDRVSADERLHPVEDAVHRLVLAAGRAAGAAVDVGTVGRLVRDVAPLLAASDVDRVVSQVLARVGGLGPLEPLLADPAVTEVMVNGPGPVWVERAGRLHRTDTRLDTATIELLIARIVAPLGLRVDRTAPLVDARLADGSRVNAVVAPLAVDGPCLTIRRFGARVVPLEAMAPPAVTALLRWAVEARANVVVSGGTGAGKTTLLNALAAAIPAGERIITVEDAAELRLPGDHVVRLEARPANAEGVGAIAIRDLVRNALRMRPDRIVVGECRGPEALDMVQAMNTGHEGSLSTCHANGPEDALRRLETMILMGDVGLPLVAVRDQLSASIDLLVQVARAPEGGRRVTAVAEVTDGASAGERVRLLADDRTLHALPHRAGRDPAAGPPDPGWVTA